MVGFLAGMLTSFFLSTIVYAQTNGDNPADKTNHSESAEVVKNSEDLIHFGDLIEVDVIGSTEYDWRVSLTPEGFLDGLNFVEKPVYGLCRTKEEVAADVVKGYEKFLRSPQVAVKILDRSHRAVSLLYGAVKTPQRFQIKRPVRLNELLILAGGVTDKLSGEIQILRSPNLSCAAQKSDADGQTKDEKKTDGNIVPAKQESGSQVINIKISDLLKGEPESNPFILSGDVVTVLESQPIYVTGGVVNPKQINARSQINLARAIAIAGGLTKNADPKKITIFRLENHETKAIDVDFEKIKTGQTPDLPLQAFDIVEVSQKGKGKSKFAPVIRNVEEMTEKSRILPLMIID
ncbi:MAG: polysaccharide biosynthesis/export family protein [Pyrinomonadaceae bacterium]